MHLCYLEQRTNLYEKKVTSSAWQDKNYSSATLFASYRHFEQTSRYEMEVAIVFIIAIDFSNDFNDFKALKSLQKLIKIMQIPYFSHSKDASHV